MMKYFETKDLCRQGLIKYLDEICLKIPLTGNLNILDIGCGTGVPTLRLAETFQGVILAIDSDEESLNYLKQKISDEKLQSRITTLCTSFSDFQGEMEAYDIIVAEGFLNVVGFEAGYTRIIKLLRKNGFFIIHDEYKDHEMKCNLIRDFNCSIIDTLYLDEKVWWNDYYRTLEEEVIHAGMRKELEIFRKELSEIEAYRKEPEVFRSMYYLVTKQ